MDLNSNGMGLFMLARLRQGQQQTALQVEELNLLRAHRGLPPIELQPMISGAPATIMWWCFKISMFIIVAMLGLFALAIGYIILHALVFGIPS